MALADGTLYSLVMNESIRFCQLCGRGLVDRTIDGRSRRHCDHCNQTVFLDPKVAAVVLALVDGKLVLVKRGIEPQMGRWAFPSGFVDRGEAVEDAAVREFKEETGLDAKLERLIGVYSDTGSPVVLRRIQGRGHRRRPAGRPTTPPTLPCSTRTASRLCPSPTTTKSSPTGGP